MDFKNLKKKIREPKICSPAYGFLFFVISISGGRLLDLHGADGLLAGQVLQVHLRGAQRVHSRGNHRQDHARHRQGAQLPQGWQIQIQIPPKKGKWQYFLAKNSSLLNEKK
jgi:hypothetical protein